MNTATNNTKTYGRPVGSIEMGRRFTRPEILSILRGRNPAEIIEANRAPARVVLTQEEMYANLFGAET